MGWGALNGMDKICKCDLPDQLKRNESVLVYGAISRTLTSKLEDTYVDTPTLIDKISKMEWNT